MTATRRGDADGDQLCLADPPDAEIIYLEDMASADYLPSPTQVASYLAAFGTLSQKALNPATSSVLIKNAALGGWCRTAVSGDGAGDDEL